MITIELSLLGEFFLQRPLVFRDFWELDDSDRAVNQKTRLEKEWKVELTRENPSVHYQNHFIASRLR